MANIGVTYTFTNGTKADGGQVNTNFSDIVNGLSDGTKNIEVNEITCSKLTTSQLVAPSTSLTYADIYVEEYIYHTDDTTTNIRFQTGQVTINAATSVEISTISNATTDTDKFLVSDSGVIKYRTGAELLSDIGAGTLNNIVEDTTPQLGGNLDLNGNVITGSGSGSNGLYIDNDDEASFKNTSSITNQRVNPITIIGRTTADMVDNFGPEVPFYLFDATAYKRAGSIAFTRNGADDSSQYWLYLVNSNTERIAQNITTNRDHYHVLGDASGTRTFNIQDSNQISVFTVNSDGLLTSVTGQIGDISGGNYSEFETDGTLVFNGDATVWKDENFSGINGFGGSVPGLVAWDSGTVYTTSFDGTTTSEQLFGLKELQHDYKEGTDLVFHIHWTPTTAGAGNVEWFIDYTIERGDSGTIASGTLSVVDAADGTAWLPTRVNIGTVTGTSLLMGDQIGARLYRVPTGGNDTYAADAALAFTWGYHYEVDTVGSRTITSK